MCLTMTHLRWLHDQRGPQCLYNEECWLQVIVVVSVFVINVVKVQLVVYRIFLNGTTESPLVSGSGFLERAPRLYSTSNFFNDRRNSTETSSNTITTVEDDHTEKESSSASSQSNSTTEVELEPWVDHIS